MNNKISNSKNNYNNYLNNNYYKNSKSKHNKEKNKNISKIIETKEFYSIEIITEIFNSIEYNNNKTSFNLLSDNTDINSLQNNYNILCIPELTKSIVKDLIEINLDCLVCSEEIKHKSEIWSCEVCYTIFHLNCIVDWMMKLNSNVYEESSKSKVIENLKFTCPHCSNLYKHSPNSLPEYNCFCKKFNDSNYYYDISDKINTNSIYIPHSCGLKCNKVICSHIKCMLPCHPGPHVVCLENVERLCYCGKLTKTTKCNELFKSFNFENDNEDNDIRFSCNNQCNKLLKCGKHNCDLNCHPGDCMYNNTDKCDKNQISKNIINEECKLCFIEVEDKLKRMLINLDKLSYDIGITTEFSEVIINYIFNNKLPCNKHFDNNSINNSRIENRLFNQSQILSINSKLTEFYKLLKISGDRLLVNLKNYVPLCKIIDENYCRCKSTSKPAECFVINYSENYIDYLNKNENELLLIPSPQNISQINKDININNLAKLYINYKKYNSIPKNVSCKKLCKTLKSCKIHYCFIECCELKGIEGKLSYQDPKGIHLCTKRCGKLLKCNIHQCIDSCHKGNCLPCHNLIRDKPLVCDCGSTKIEPPYKCSQEIVCTKPCLKDRNCHHPCQRLCHKGECTACEEIVTKKCVCGKNLIRSICSKTAYCNDVCNEILPCGVHFCKEKCHQHIDDFKDSFTCNLKCGRTKSCNHVCDDVCHGEDLCNTSNCNSKVKVKCKCGNALQYLKCKEIQLINIKNSKTINNIDNNNIENKNLDNIDLFETNILDCNSKCQRILKLKKFEEAFNGLKKYSEEQSKSYLSKSLINSEKSNNSFKACNINNENLNKNNFNNIYLEYYCDIKYTYGMTKYAKDNTDLINNVENFVEDYLSHVSNPSGYDTFYCEKNSLNAIHDLLTNIYNVEVTKVYNKTLSSGVITITNGSSARFPRFRLSLFGLLFKNNKFFKKEYNNEGPYKIYHPFEQSFFIRDYKSSNFSDELELHLINNKIVNSAYDYYIDLDSKDIIYVHFFKADTCARAFENNRKFTSPFQNCYLLDQYNILPVSMSLKNETTTDINNNNIIVNAIHVNEYSNYFQRMYKYKSNKDYFYHLDDYEDKLYIILKNKEKEDKNKIDDDGFITVKNKKNR